MISFFSRSFFLFWKQNPALWVALSLTLGLMAQLLAISSILPYVFIWGFLPKKEKILSILFFLSAFFFAHEYYKSPSEGMPGLGLFTIKTYTPSKFGGWLYKGTLDSFEPLGKSCIKTHISCSVFSDVFYEPSFKYAIEGTCRKKGSIVVIKSHKPWIQKESVFSLAKLRDQTKKHVIYFFREKLPDKKVSSFLSSLVTGVAQDEIQKHVFAKLGLAHLFAVSGFHFALFACVFHFILRLFLPRKVESCLLLLILSIFFLFIGNCPSVARSWFMAIFALIALLLDKEKRSLNTLGLSLFFVILIDPYYVTDLSFQLSFLATGGILLLYSSLDYCLQYFLPKKDKNRVLEKNLFFQYLYILGSFFRKAMALNLAVHIVLFPIYISLFSKFPWHSLVYNLFFPFLVSIALFFLSFSSLMYFVVPVMGDFFFFLTTRYTKIILWFTEFPPFPEHNWYVEKTIPYLSSVMLTALFLGGVLGKYYITQKKGENFDSPLLNNI